MPQPLQGELIRLRAREETDVDHFYRWINDWQVTKFLGARYVQSRKFESEWLASGDPGPQEARFVVETLDDQKPIGWVGLHPGFPENRTAGLGIAIGEHEFLDGGYGTDTMRTVCRFGLEMMNLHRIELSVFDWNTRAIRVYEKVGFKHEGVARDAMWKANRWHQLAHMGLLRGELR
ncbi:GNAT family protein [Candidatus Amarobacter glycogenicus]|uniref:GNAT family N-acetyltransferase n=1 Tax=Candidatus Amarobacter glycogenicus TaxID=3140699 RepID=UPI0031350416|nr:GNAT family N-acetyltransferase [Dehalococcoidia bacterium]